MNIITSQKIDESKRIHHTATLFGNNFPMIVEPTIYAIAERLSVDYRGGYWNFHQLSNGGFYIELVPYKATALFIRVPA